MKIKMTREALERMTNTIINACWLAMMEINPNCQIGLKAFGEKTLAIIKEKGEKKNG